jgi:hypothetical protein
MADSLKTCIRCGQDCSGKPRVKNAQGRYTCRACLKPEEAARMGQRATVAAVAAPSAPGPAPEPDDAIPLDLADVESAAPAAAALCPSCRSSIPYGAMVCVQCGFHVASGKQFKTRAGDHLPEDPTIPDRAPARAKCPKCGYDLKGLKKPRCPECGTAVLPKDPKEKARDLSRETARWAYLKPLIQFAVGFAISMTVLAARGHPEGIPAFAISYAIQVPIGCIAFFLCCLLWMGFDAPMHLTALRLAGVYALVDAATLVLGFLPVPLVPVLLILFLYVGLMAESLDLEIVDAVIVGLLTFFLKMGVVLVLAAVVFAHS